MSVSSGEFIKPKFYSVHRQPGLDKWRWILVCTFDVGLGGKDGYIRGRKKGRTHGNIHPGMSDSRPQGGRFIKE